MLGMDMGQKLYFYLIILAAVGTFLYFRNKDKDFLGRDKLFFFLGLLLISIGSVFIQLIHGNEVLLDCLVLKKRLVSGKFILIGYILILLSFFFFVDRIIDKFKSKMGK